jgi:uncharacterized protein (TIGR02611 family)
MLLRIIRVVAGIVLLVAGTAMLVLPGPGWLTIAAAVALLASEFQWARRLLARLKDGASSLGLKLPRGGTP